MFRWRFRDSRAVERRTLVGKCKSWKVTAVCRQNVSAQLPRFTRSLFSRLQFNKCNFSSTYATLLHPADMRSPFHTVDRSSLDVVEADGISFVNVLFQQHQKPHGGAINQNGEMRCLGLCAEVGSSMNPTQLLSRLYDAGQKPFDKKLFSPHLYYWVWCSSTMANFTQFHSLYLLFTACNPDILWGFYCSSTGNTCCVNKLYIYVHLSAPICEISSMV